MKELSEREEKMIMMKNELDFFQNVNLMLTNRHVGLCLIQMAHSTSLQKTRIMRSQVQHLIRSSDLYKFVSVLKVNNLHLGLCFVEMENLYQKMNASWHKDVHLFFRENTWTDIQVALDWVNKTLKPATEHRKRFVLLADNLTGQFHRDFKEHISNCSDVV